MNSRKVERRESIKSIIGKNWEREKEREREGGREREE